MITEKERIKFEKRLKKNKKAGLFPASECDFAKMIGVRRQMIYYVKNNYYYKSANVEKKIKEFIYGK